LFANDFIMMKSKKPETR